MVDFAGHVKLNNVPSSVWGKDSNHSKRSNRTSGTGKGGRLAGAAVFSASTDNEGDTYSRTMSVSQTGRTALSTTNREMEEHDQKSKRVVRRLKITIFLFFTLTAVGVAAAFFVYRSYNNRALDTAFKKRFKEEAHNMLANIGANLDASLGAFDAFTVSMLAQAKATNQTWPYVTIDDFATQAGKLLKNSRAKYITTFNLVPSGERETWEEYAKTHNYWIDQSIDIQSRDPGYKGPEITPEFIKNNYSGHYDLLHDYTEAVFGWENSTDGVDHDGPYLPLWQSAPVIPIDPIYNWDYFGNGSWTGTLEALFETHLVTITPPYMINWPWQLDFEWEHQVCAEWISNYIEPHEDPREPMIDIYYPIIETLLENVIHHDEDYSAATVNDTDYDFEANKLGGMLSSSFYFRDAFRDLLPTGSAGVVIVVRNPCDDVPPFGYEITGPIPRYLGIGYHNQTVTEPSLNISTNMLAVWDFGVANSSYTGVPVNEELCPYTIEVYPAESAREYFLENSDNSVYVVLILVLVVSILTIAFTFLFFFLYDRLVRNEIQAKINLLDAKRNFVRFVSHEVRTPLNTVCMGLTLIVQEFKVREKQLRKKMEQEGGGEGGGSEADETTREDFARWSTLTQEVNNNADVAVGVLNDLLNIDKIQMGAFKLEMEVLPIFEIVEQTTNEFKMMANKQNIKLKLDMSKLAQPNPNLSSSFRDPNAAAAAAAAAASAVDVETAAMAITNTSMLPSAILDQTLVGDEQRLRQVLRNLLSNAIKFSKNGSVTTKISMRDHSNTPNPSKKMDTKEYKMSNGTTQTFLTNGSIVVDVVDTGVGMTPQQLETVFDVGTQFNANKLQSGGGSGLGLAFAKAIAEQHGGSLRAYSAGKDQGTTFRLDLPLHIDIDSLTRKPLSSTSTSSDTDTKKAARAKEDSADEDELEPMRILVVDDAPMNRKLLVRLLEMNGHTCDTAENGQDLIDTVRKNMVQYDCILVDYEMPVMNGPEACKGVREMGYTGFVVGVTGNLLPEDVGYFMDCGADAVLPKPFKYKALEDMLIEHGMFDLS